MKIKESHAPIWQLQEAKNRLSEVVHATETIGPQTITRHGKPVVIMVPIMTMNENEGLSAWELLHDEHAAKVGGPIEQEKRSVDLEADVPLPW